MEWLSRRRWSLLFGSALALASLLAVVSFAPQDPTLTNLRYPKDGVGNWLGYPGALLAGSLVEGFGWAALAVPAALLYWTLFSEGRPRGWRHALHAAGFVLFGASWSGQWVQLPALGLASPGVIGWICAQWARESLGPTGAAAALALGLALAGWHLFYSPRRDDWLRIRALGGSFGRPESAGTAPSGQAQPPAAGAWIAPGVALLAPLRAAMRIARGAAAALLGGVPALLVHRQGARTAGAGASRPGDSRASEPMTLTRHTGYGSPGRDRAGAEFDGSPARDPAVAATAHPPEDERRPAADSGPERWERLLRSYRSHLGLDEEGRWHAADDAERGLDDGAQSPRRAR